MENDNIIYSFYLENIDYSLMQKRDRIRSLNISPDYVHICVYCENNEPPHFHIVFNDNFKTDNCCLKIVNKEPYPHGHHNRILTNKQLKNLNKELSKNDHKVLKLIIEKWNEKNKNNLVKIEF